MNLTVEQVLMIAGRLDDSPGFDTPRERFRRFLNGRLTDVPSARLVIQQCQQTAGEQNRRALQDAIVLAGRCLGFTTLFGPYQHDPGAAPISGAWESRRRLHVTLSVCGPQTAAIELDALAKAVRNGGHSHEGGATHRIGLCVTTAFFPAKARAEEMVTASGRVELRLISVDGLLHMADMVAAGRLTHDDVLRILDPGVSLDSIVDLIDGVATAPRPQASEPPVESGVATQERSHGWWVAGLRLGPISATARFVDASLAKRRILSVTSAANVHTQVAVGDGLCVFVEGVGLVAQARVAEVISGGAAVREESERSTQVLRLDEVAVYSDPIVPAPELVRRLEIGDAIPVATPLSRQEFALLTRASATPI